MSVTEPKDGFGDFDPSREHSRPASMLLPGAVVQRTAQLYQNVEGELEQKGLQVPEERRRFLGFDEAPIRPFQLGEIDNIRLTSFTLRDDGAVTIGVRLFSDGSPYVYNEDIDRHGHRGNGLDYDVVILGGEVPPFIVPDVMLNETAKHAIHESTQATNDYIDAVRDGTERPLRLINESACQQLLGYVQDPSLGNHVDVAELRSIADPAD